MDKSLGASSAAPEADTRLLLRQLRSAQWPCPSYACLAGADLERWHLTQCRHQEGVAFACACLPPATHGQQVLWFWTFVLSHAARAVFGVHRHPTRSEAVSSLSTFPEHWCAEADVRCCSFSVVMDVGEADGTLRLRLRLPQPAVMTPFLRSSSAFLHARSSWVYFWRWEWILVCTKQ